MRRAVTTRPWLAVLVIYAASRIVSTVLLGAVFVLATAQHWTFASYRSNPTFFTFSGSWDASAYKTIAEHGYPLSLPLDSSGHVLPNPWAFLPVFPGIVRAVSSATGVGFYPAGVAAATVFGFGAALMLYRLLILRVPKRQSLFAVVLFCVGPMGFLLQTAYAESTFLFFLFAALWCLATRRYLLLVPFAVVAAFTRPGVLALALTLGVHFVVRLVASRRGRSVFPVRHMVSIVVAAAVVSVAGLAWPVIATAVTHTPDAYLDTELSWWVGFVGRRHFAPLTPWFVMATTFVGWAGILLVLVVIAAGAFWLTRRSSRALGHEVVGFTASYWLYLVAVFLPQQSLIRLMLPVAPLLGSSVFSTTRRRRITAVSLGILLQAVAVVFLWFLGYP
ncbi:membrane protein [Frondihabitans sucicola]|uniref:Membrane protein n=1 Tax=Frondihabitans sucicola TaxID=1268041 RepID=A0ABN6XVZ3_9MICO|nr:hypothetical protein [Frondihabitans sucicola]BDZ49207.1 membrane protein [Frondihabitans sucicola]